MPSRRRLLTMATTASLTAVAGCIQSDSPPQFEFHNTADRKLELDLTVMTANGETSSPQTVDAGVGEMWTWQYWVEPGEAREEPGPMKGSNAYVVRATTGDDESDEAWMHGYERAIVSFDANAVNVAVVDPD